MQAGLSYRPILIPLGIKIRYLNLFYGNPEKFRYYVK